MMSRRLQWANNSPIFQNILVLFSPFTRGLLQKGNKMVIIWDWDELSIHQSVCLMWYTCTNGMCFLIRELFSRQEKIHFLNKNILHPRYDALKKTLMSSEADITAIKIRVKKISLSCWTIWMIWDISLIIWNMGHIFYYLQESAIYPRGKRKLLFMKWQWSSPALADIQILYSLRKWTLFLTVDW